MLLRKTIKWYENSKKKKKKRKSFDDSPLHSFDFSFTKYQNIFIELFMVDVVDDELGLECVCVSSLFHITF